MLARERHPERIQRLMLAASRPILRASSTSGLSPDPESPEQKSARLQVMQRLDSAIAFVDRDAVEKGRATLEAELLTT